MTVPEAKYRLRYDSDGNVLFLDYGGGEFVNYDYRWIWTRRNHHSRLAEWFLVCFPDHHPNALALLPREIELAKQAYEEITNKKDPLQVAAGE